MSRSTFFKCRLKRMCQEQQEGEGGEGGGGGGGGGGEGGVLNLTFLYLTLLYFILLYFTLLAVYFACLLVRWFVQWFVCLFVRLFVGSCVLVCVFDCPVPCFFVTRKKAPETQFVRKTSSEIDVAKGGEKENKSRSPTGI